MAPLVGHEHKWRNVMRPSLAVAAVLTLCVGAAAIGFALGRGRPSDSTPAAQSPLASSQPGFKSPVIGVEPAIFSSVEVNQQVQAFQQVNQVFDGKASWLYQSNGESDVGLAASESRNAKSVVWLRLTMRRNGQLASSADLVIVPGGTARLRVPSRQGPAVQYLLSTSANEPTQVSLWAELVAPGGAQTLAALAATLQPKPGQTMAAGQLVTSAGEYDLMVSFAKGGEALP